MKRIVLTRPQEDNIRVVNEFTHLTENKKENSFCMSDKGQLFLSSPALEIKNVLCDLTSLPQVDALIVTSANALPFLLEAAAAPYKSLQSFVVGERTAKDMRKLGFESVHSFIDAAALSQEISSEKHKDLKNILYLRGEDISFDFTDSISAIGGRELIQKIIYRAFPIDKISDEALAALQNGEVGAITFFSKRSALIFLDLIHREGLLSIMNGISPLCISASVLECVQSYMDGKAYIAKTPDLEGMLNIMVEFVREDVQE